jgi:prepilin-type N-terminal cleavage/methylation domain-containing protein
LHRTVATSRKGPIRLRRQRLLCSERSDAAFTLLEMILVLTILLTVLTVSYPALNHLYVVHQLRQGADEVQVRLMACRVRAIEAGLTYQFRFEPGGQRFVAVPYDSATMTGGSSLWKHGGELPATVQFVSNSVFPGMGEELPAGLLNGLSNAGEMQGAHWSAPILFKPDGSSSGGVFELKGKDGDIRTVSVRALTGGVTVASSP